MQAILPLVDCKSAPIEEVGSKAKRLAELLSRDFPVPLGLVVTERAFRSFCSYNDLDGDKPSTNPEQILEGNFPPGMERAILDAVKTSVGEGFFAVRSSSSMEDGTDFSMAGQFETLLDVSLLRVPDAIKRCWASRLGRPVSAYLKKAGTHSVPSMGVIVQNQVKPLFSGVVFTLDPVTKSTDYLVVEWVEGMGEKLVSGRIVPGRIHLRRVSGAMPKGLPEALAHNISQLRRFALDAEKIFHQPVDMEWCCDRESLYVLQARPITAISSPSAVAWTNVNMAENFPKVLAPLAWSAVDIFYTHYMRCALKLFGWSESGLSRAKGTLTSLNGVHCGRIYYNLNSWYDVMHLFPIGRWLTRFLDTYIGQKSEIALDGKRRGQGPIGLPARASQLLLFWPRFLWVLFSAKRYLDGLEVQFHHMRSGWRQVSGNGASIKVVFDTIQDIFQRVDTSWQGPVCADLKVMVATGLLETLIGRWISKDTDPVMAKLMQGIEVKSTEPAKLIWQMSQEVKGNAKLRKLIEAKDYEGLEKNLDQRQRQLLDFFMEEFGARCYHDCMLIYPTFEERHHLYWDLVRGYIASEGHASRLEKEDETKIDQALNSVIKSLPFHKRLILKGALALSRDATVLRERGRLFQSLLFGELRRLVLVLGRLLKKMGHLNRADDIFYLHLPEIRDLVEGKFLFPELLSKIIKLRKKAHEENSAIEPPEFFISEKAEYFMPVAEDVRHNDSYSLVGLGVSGGRKVGRVKIVLDPASGHGLRKGDILVAKTTDPGWTPLFFMAGGLVLEKGGMLSHGAIVAREFGIPAIVAMEGATKILKDGQMIEMDGTSGTVVLLSGRQRE